MPYPFHRSKFIKFSSARYTKQRLQKLLTGYSWRIYFWEQLYWQRWYWHFEDSPHRPNTRRVEGLVCSHNSPLCCVSGADRTPPTAEENRAWTFSSQRQTHWVQSLPWSNTGSGRFPWSDWETLLTYSANVSRSKTCNQLNNPFAHHRTHFCTFFCIVHVILFFNSSVKISANNEKGSIKSKF